MITDGDKLQSGQGLAVTVLSPPHMLRKVELIALSNEYNTYLSFQECLHGLFQEQMAVMIVEVEDKSFVLSVHKNVVKYPVYLSQTWKKWLHWLFWKAVFSSAVFNTILIFIHHT